MSIVVVYGAVPVLLCLLVCLLFAASFCHGSQSDIDCVRFIKNSFIDPQNSLANWEFPENATQGFICRFSGIDCWHDGENRVLNIHLQGRGLRGEFPLGISGCSSMTGFDLSGNNIYGSIPSNISALITYVTALDLSSNQFTGEIPENLANCTFLNVVRLDHNQLSGQIPSAIGTLPRLTRFSVAGNRLSGPVPSFANVTTDYADNAGLCGSATLPQCGTSSGGSRLIGAVIGVVCGLGFIALVSGSLIWYHQKLSKKKKKKDNDPLGNKWAKDIKRSKIKLSMFEKPMSNMSLKDLMKATNDFSSENIIGSGRTGTMYKAKMEDGTVLMVKRLQDTQHSEKEIVSEMNTLGKVKNRNLVPLLGYCLARKERLLVYPYLSNGMLHEKLHNIRDGQKAMDWPLRLKIGTRAAKGLAFLHHGCNPRIIHRNISSKCILLDADYEPKISDFGLARLMNPIDTHLSTFVNGEFGDLGYVAPEYTRTLVVTPKGDVYSFGIVLLELVTGEEPTSVSRAPENFNGNLAEWISQLSKQSKLQDAIDKSLLGHGYDNEVFQFLKVACNCVLLGPKERPTMFEVYHLLRAIGQRYDFSTQDDVLTLSNSMDSPQLVELIVARDA